MSLPVPAQPQPTTNKPKVEEVEEEVVHEPIDMGEVVVDLTDNNNDNQDIWVLDVEPKKAEVITLSDSDDNMFVDDIKVMKKPTPKQYLMVDNYSDAELPNRKITVKDMGSKSPPTYCPMFPDIQRDHSYTPMLLLRDYLPPQFLMPEHIHSLSPTRKCVRIPNGGILTFTDRGLHNASSNTGRTFPEGDKVTTHLLHKGFKLGSVAQMTLTVRATQLKFTAVHIPLGIFTELMRITDIFVMERAGKFYMCCTPYDIALFASLRHIRNRMDDFPSVEMGE